MKKVLFIFCVLASSASFGQSFVGKMVSRLSFGLKAGANYSNYTHADFATDALIGFHAGALVNFKLSEHFSFQEEFLFSSQGAKVKGDLFGTENVNVYYITVPFLLKYKTSFGLYVEAGTQTGLNIKDDAGNVPKGDFAKKIDLAAAGGLGYQSRSGFGIGARYIAGLSNVGNFNISDVHTDFKTNVLQASVFYIF